MIQVDRKIYGRSKKKRRVDYCCNIKRSSVPPNSDVLSNKVNKRHLRKKLINVITNKKMQDIYCCDVSGIWSDIWCVL